MREVDGARLRAHGELDPGVGRGEPRQARAEPAAGEGGHDGDHQRAGRRAAAHLLDRAGEAGEGLAQLGQGAPAGLGQRQPARQAAEQGDAEVGLEEADLLADRGRGHGELVGGPGEAAEAGGGLEGAERVQGRQAARHGREHKET